MKRLAEFIRPVIPADPTQLLFLAGIVCLNIAPHLRWWPDELRAGAGDNVTRAILERAGGVVSLSLWPIVFSAIAGYWICFRGCRRPALWIVTTVMGPAIVGLGFVSAQIVNFSRVPTSVLETRSAQWAGLLHWVLGGGPPGVHLCLAGLFLIAIYTSRIAFGIAQLPLCLPGGSSVAAESPEAWQRLQSVIWVLVGPLYLLYGFVALVTASLPTILSRLLPVSRQVAWYPIFSTIMAALAALLVILWVMGKDSRQVLWSSVWLPEPRSVGLGLAFPVGIALLLSTGQYLLDRAMWAAHDFGRFSPPQFRTYFDVPDPWLVLLFFPALFEEMVFRGLLQRRFIQRYGVYRGIFLVGIVWAAYHFVSDFSFSRLSETDVLLRIGWRVLSCLALSYVLGWLTLRFGSILPAAVAHTSYNVLVISRFGPQFPGKTTVLAVLSAILALVLFRYWPVQAERGLETRQVVADPEPAA